MPRPDDPHEAFAARYREFMIRTLDRFEFFGVDPHGIARRHSFTDGYVPLTLNQRDPSEAGTVSVGARADQALADHRSALVRGIAGAGKSTLLRWLGVTAAHGPGADTPAAVPFFLELGRYADGRLPDLGQAVAEPLRQMMPNGWVHRMLAEGRVLLLLDGLEEVRPRERVHLEEWVDRHLAAYPDIRCVVTTRPSVVAEQWWVDRRFQRFDLLPMSRHSIEEYVHGWHEVAYAADQRGSRDGAEVRESPTSGEQRLLATLYNWPALRGMSANPLLCGLLCALYRVRAEQLPESRKEVYDAALDLLLSRWPILRARQRSVTRDESVDTVPDVRLAFDELVKLLQRLAFWLVTNREKVLSPDVARDRVASFMSGLRNGDEDPDRVLQYLAHESGLLRELPDCSLQFVHRTFRDYLAAKEVVDEEYFGLLLDSADKPHWHDVVVMAGAHARPRERTRILRALIERGRSEPDHRDALYLLAATIVEQAVVLPQDPQSSKARAQVAEAMVELIPPRTSAAADQLAAAGEFVLDLLPGPDGLGDRQAALVVRAAARIAALRNPPGAVEKILQFTENGGSQVINEVLGPWGRLGDYERYAREVLSKIDFSRFTIDLQSWHRIEHIGYLRTISSLVVRNDVPGLGPLADLPHLRRLTLGGNKVTNLQPLPASRSLRVVVLDQCSFMDGTRPVDLSPLGKFDDLRRLVVSGLQTKVDLAGLAGVRLDSMRLSGAALFGSPVLPPGLQVRHLSLTGRPRRVELTGVQGIRSVILDWAPSDDELAVLAGLPELRRLVLWQVPPGTPKPVLPSVDVIVFYSTRGQGS
jgi:NACHT domain